VRHSLLFLGQCCLLLSLSCATGGGSVLEDASRPDSSTTTPDAETSTDAGPDGAKSDAGEFDAGEFDAGVDASTDSGAPVDAGRPCFSDEGCSDGLACNGEDYCDMTTRLCAVRPHAGCDDGIACTADSCGDPSGDCTHLPDDSLCAPTETCDPTTGCVTPPACSGDAECDNGNFCDLRSRRGLPQRRSPEL